MASVVLTGITVGSIRRFLKRGFLTYARYRDFRGVEVGRERAPYRSAGFNPDFVGTQRSFTTVFVRTQPARRLTYFEHERPHREIADAPVRFEQMDGKVTIN